MAHVTLLTIPANAFVGDNDAQLVAGDVACGLANHIGRPVLSFDDTAEKAAVSASLTMPGQYAAGTLKATLHLYAAEAGDGAETTDFEAYVEAMTPGTDTTNLVTTDGFDAANEVAGGVLIPTDVGAPFTAEITLANKDSVAAGDLIRIGVRRDCDDGDDDDGTGDMYLAAVEIWEDT